MPPVKEKQPIPGDEDFTAQRIEHLKMIQNVIDRMATASASFKRYAVLLSAATAALVLRPPTEPGILLVVAGLLLVFWWLDAKYLSQEVWFRTLYTKVRLEPPNQRPDFNLSPDHESCHWGRKFCSWSVAFFYGTIIAFLVGVWLLLSSGTAPT